MDATSQGRLIARFQEERQKEVIDSERLRWWLQDENSVLPGFRLE
jgi:hypothetical protein